MCVTGVIAVTSAPIDSTGALWAFPRPFALSQKLSAAAPTNQGFVGRAASLAAAMPEICFDEVGALEVCSALAASAPVEARRLSHSLRGHALRAAMSPHASLVLEAIVQQLPTQDSAFVAEELICAAPGVAMHAIASGVVCRLLEFSAADPRTAALVDAALAGKVAALCCHKTGHCLVASVLSNGLPRQRREVLRVIESDVQRFARHRFASSVVAAALLHSPGDEAAGLASVIMKQSGAIVTLACHAFGAEVVRAVLEVPGEAEHALHYLRKAGRRVWKDRYGAALLEELGLCFVDDAPVTQALSVTAVVGGA